MEGITAHLSFITAWEPWCQVVRPSNQSWEDKHLERNCGLLRTDRTNFGSDLRKHVGNVLSQGLVQHRLKSCRSFRNTNTLQMQPELSLFSILCLVGVMRHLQTWRTRKQVVPTLHIFSFLSSVSLPHLFFFLFVTLLVIFSFHRIFILTVCLWYMHVGRPAMGHKWESKDTGGKAALDRQYLEFILYTYAGVLLIIKFYLWSF